MADRNISALPQAPQIDDDSLLVMEQQGQAMKVTGAQFKDFGRQAVIGQVQGYVDAAEKAADQAVDAVSAVTGMTVTAHPSREASVVKSTVDGKVRLTFGLPQGDKGDPGEQGPQGLRGPQGAPGNGLTILGQYNTEAALRAAVTAPKVGDAYSVGTELPYDTYIFDGVINDWKNHGPLSGGGGTILPENVVTTPGGAALEFSSGDGPHTIEFDFEEEEPLTAGDIVYGEGSVADALSKLFTSGSEGKSLIASAVTAKGVETAADATFAEMADNIGKITTSGDTSDATATPGDILAGKTAYTAAGKVEGIIPRLEAKTYTPGTADQTIANGQYLGGTQTIKGDPNLTSGNIRKGVSLFGVEGAVESSFQAVLTVTADIGAVVTATNGDTTVEALSTTGTVVLELPHEGTWKVTAQRGMAQYNTVVIEVSSQYNATLTAEVHIEYFLSKGMIGRSHLAAASVGDYALFAGGEESLVYNADSFYDYTTAYDSDLTVSYPTRLSQKRSYLAAAPVGNYALFGGGRYYKYNSHYSEYQEVSSDVVDAYDASLVHTVPTPFSGSVKSLAAAAVGNYALFAGGCIAESLSTSGVDAYDSNLTRTTPELPLIKGRAYLAAASVENHALFGGGFSGVSASDLVDAYDKYLTRTVATPLAAARGRLAAAAAGSYAVFAGGNNSLYSPAKDNAFTTADAYDLFLTKTEPEELSNAKYSFAGTTLRGFALFGGGNGSEVDVYDPFLVHTTPVSLKEANEATAAAVTSDYALFGGVYSGAVDIFRYV